MSHTESIIKELDEQTINKIAAGEVIDRPASIVKECVENSIDAGATFIQVDVAQGGIKRISVTDNGKGMSKEDLKLAPIRHATSKITSLDDIYHTLTMGFRGEALASICHVAKTSIRSKQEHTDAAYEISAYLGEITSPIESTHATGTTIDVRDLFFDIPVRRQYLKAPASELTKIQQVLVPFMLIHPHIDFVLSNEGAEIISSVGLNDVPVLMSQLLDKKCKDHLISFESTAMGLSIKGWTSDPTINFSNRNKQVIAVNKRMVFPPAVRKIIQDVYRDVIPYGRFPACVIDISIAPEAIDVNIHPKKEDIKFLQADLLFKVLPRTIRSSFSKHHDVFVAPQADRPPLDQSAFTFTPATPYPSPASETTLNHSAAHTTMGEPSYSQEVPFYDRESFAISETPSLYIDHTSKTGAVLSYFQLFNTYIVLKTADKMWILDQHAVHERILYEEIKESQAETLKDVQLLLVPEYIDLDADQMLAFEDCKDWFRTLHIDLEVFSPTQLCLRECPVIFSDCRLSEWVIELINATLEFGATPKLNPDTKAKWEMRACKAAIKAGKPLQLSEVKELCEMFVASPSNFTCPHGRPLYKTFGKSDLEKLFNRS